jgi:hypothetical protein
MTFPNMGGPDNRVWALGEGRTVGHETVVAAFERMFGSA